MTEFLENYFSQLDDNFVGRADYLVSVGYVTVIGDGIARCSGLLSVMAVGDGLFSKLGKLWLALNLEADTVGVVLFGSLMI